MKDILLKITKSILGAVAGAFTGIFAGFIPGYYYILTTGISVWEESSMDYHSPFVSLVMLAGYLATLPFFMLYQMGKGLFYGAIGGPVAGLIYPQTVDKEFKAGYYLIPDPVFSVFSVEPDTAFEDQFKHKEHIKQLVSDLTEIKTDSHYLLTSNEISALKNNINKDASYKKYEDDLNAYENILKTSAIRLVDNGYLKNPALYTDVSNPILISCFNAETNQTNRYICNRDDLLEIARRHQNDNTPVLLNINGKAEYLSAVHHINSENSPLKPFENFVYTIRKVLISVSWILRELGVGAKLFDNTAPNPVTITEEHHSQRDSEEIVSLPSRSNPQEELSQYTSLKDLLSMKK